MERTINTFYFGELTLTPSTRKDNNNLIVNCIEATDTKDNVIAVIYGYDMKEVTEDVVEEFLV